MSDRRRALADDVRDLRRRWVAEERVCWVCGHGPWNRRPDMPPSLSDLYVHELANGPCRAAALDKPYAVLVVCAYCNGMLTDKGRWPVARQLTVLLKRRPERFDLAAFNMLVEPRAPNRITLAEVEAWWESV